MPKNNGRKNTKTTKKQPARATAKKERSVPEQIRHNRIIGWILIGAAVLLAFIIVLPLDSIWLYTHWFVLGMFGYLSPAIPILIGYLGVTIALNQAAKPKTIGRTVLIFCTIASGCAFAYALQFGGVQDSVGFKAIGELYAAGASWASPGVVSGILGYMFVAMASQTGGIIITAILTIVLLLITTGVTLVQVRNAVITSRQQVRKLMSKMPVKAADKNNNEPAYSFEDDYDEPLSRSENINDNPPEENIAQAEAAENTRKSRKNRSKQKQEEKAEPEQSIQEEPEVSENLTDGELNSIYGAFGISYEEAKKESHKAFDDVFIDCDENGVVKDSPEKEESTEPKAEENTEPDSDYLAIDAPVMPKQKKSAEDFFSVADTPKKKREQRHLNNEELISQYKDDINNAMQSDDSSGAKQATDLFIKQQQANQQKELSEVVKVDDEVENYIFPPITLLKKSNVDNTDLITKELEENGKKLVEVLNSFGVSTKIVDISRGPAVTRYEIQPAAGTKISKITNLSDDIAMNLAAVGVRIEAPIPGKAAVGVEVPNKTVSVVKMRELVESRGFQTAESRLTVALGRDISGKIVLADLAKMPHVLIAGATGSGKSVCINSIIVSLLYKAHPNEVKLLMIDPKVVELGIYNGIPHLLVPVVTDPRKASGALSWAVNEMLNRYNMFANYNVRDIHSFNRMVGEGMITDDGIELKPMPQIVIIIDELADLMMAAPKEVEDSICRLAQMARAAGMYLVIATQRPSVDVITGIIKANIPSRIAFAVSSQVDSRTILDTAGAEKLLGRGDMLYAPSGKPKPLRVQGCFLDDREVEGVVRFVKQKHKSEYDEEIIEEIERNAQERTIDDESASGAIDEDPLIPEAVKIVLDSGCGSTSMLQRRLRIGHPRAGRLMDLLEMMGVVGPQDGSKPREVLITKQDWLEMQAVSATNKNDKALEEKRTRQAEDAMQIQQVMDYQQEAAGKADPESENIEQPEKEEQDSEPAEDSSTEDDFSVDFPNMPK